MQWNLQKWKKTHLKRQIYIKEPCYILNGMGTQTNEADDGLEVEFHEEINDRSELVLDQID